MHGKVCILLRDAAVLDTQHVLGAVGNDIGECLLVGVEVIVEVQQLVAYAEHTDVIAAGPCSHIIGKRSIGQVVVLCVYLVANGGYLRLYHALHDGEHGHHILAVG